MMNALRTGWDVLRWLWSAPWRLGASSYLAVRSSLLGQGYGLADAQEAQVVVPVDYLVDQTQLELQFGDVLGNGGFTMVYVAKYRGDKVAAKVFRVDVDHQDMVTVFQHEGSYKVDALAHIQRQGGHEHIVQLKGATSDFHGQHVILLEYCDGGTLKDHINLGLSTLTVHEAFLQIARAVAWLHALQPKIIHRDLKCSNILLSGRPARAKLADFGLAKLKKGVGVMRRPGWSVSTVALSQPCGTHSWMAPELLAEDDAYSEAVDVYSFGVTMLESFYPNESIASERVPKEVLPTSLGIFKRPLIPDDGDPRFTALIRRCLDMDSELRPLFPAIVAALEDVVHAQ